MQTSNTKPLPLGVKVWCSLFGHNFETSRTITKHFKEIKCSVCQLELTNDVDGHKISLTPKIRNVNDTLIHFYQKRHHLI